MSLSHEPFSSSCRSPTASSKGTPKGTRRGLVAFRATRRGASSRRCGARRSAACYPRACTIARATRGPTQSPTPSCRPSRSPAGRRAAPQGATAAASMSEGVVSIAGARTRRPSPCPGGRFGCRCRSRARRGGGSLRARRRGRHGAARARGERRRSAGRLPGAVGNGGAAGAFARRRSRRNRRAVARGLGLRDPGRGGGGGREPDGRVERGRVGRRRPGVEVTLRLFLALLGSVLLALVPGPGRAALAAGRHGPAIEITVIHATRSDAGASIDPLLHDLPQLGRDAPFDRYNV